MSASADDQPESDSAVEDAQAIQRFELMQSRMESIKVRSDDRTLPGSFEAKPIFRYNDPARHYVAAAVWKLGAEGRPRAIVTTELHRDLRGSPRIVYEYLSLSSTRFTVASSEYEWSPDGTTLEFKTIREAEAPEATPARRFLQMRAIAKRFSGEEIVSNQRTTLRLLPQPIDRYTPTSDERSDGGIFLLCFGTNPEVAVLIESDGKKWRYAAGRLTAATAATVLVDHVVDWNAPTVSHGPTQPYTASDSVVKIPGIGPDGKEITEPKP